jgi:hypothetical protein
VKHVCLRAHVSPKSHGMLKHVILYVVVVVVREKHVFFHPIPSRQCASHLDLQLDNSSQHVAVGCLDADSGPKGITVVSSAFPFALRVGIPLGSHPWDVQPESAHVDHG